MCEGVSESLSGKLLIASPSMPDYFHRTVILMVEHADEGAFGLVLNRPSETTVGEASPELADLIGEQHVLHVGGPVQPNAVTAIGDELEQDAWIVEDAHPDDPFGDGDLWAVVLGRKGGEFALLARMPPDPSVN